ncbi:hypothetical protein IQE94_10935 [Synechocystis sp. PCC 7339]|uniref:hypothetical protein n=1 Tax=unclassified Synechocystis TaxID=2640012 RepID=UPI001BB0956F|nr:MULTISPECIES: hypothetical protein [unclassified Synechocystis]QUS59468.1 hypothetical protein HTZ78_01430 [Synechocystis sp. PCC 7338]UAJ71653.1 hypothetical protein IQE94_10935 [Synechocystis sp. PCC 7339]
MIIHYRQSSPDLLSSGDRLFPNRTGAKTMGSMGQGRMGQDKSSLELMRSSLIFNNYSANQTTALSPNP